MHSQKISKSISLRATYLGGVRNPEISIMNVCVEELLSMTNSPERSFTSNDQKSLKPLNRDMVQANQQRGLSMKETELASIKKPGEVEQVSKEEFEIRIRNIAHSKRDICWWAENFFRIVSLNTGLTKIKLYPKQRDLLKALVNNDRSIVLASR